MAKEWKTEKIVRDHFNQFSGDLLIEEKQSDNSKIIKLLKGASKSGSGSGFPDFIISFKQESNLIIAVECKASTRFHQHQSTGQMRELAGDTSHISNYAVNGALHYASYLSREFDVIALAVSGVSSDSMLISHFLYLRKEREPETIFDDRLLTVEDYLHGYYGNPNKVKQDYNALLEYAKELNEKLHLVKVKEDKRSTLISSILIALNNAAFKNSYGSHKSTTGLATNLVSTVLDEFQNAGITGKKLDCIKINLGFILTDKSLSTADQVLKDIIVGINDNIGSFVKTHEYFDVLSQLHIEFLRYSNSEKSLGIVLTPPHITELFADLAQVNKNSVVYDNCTGTGGFLISAMKRMIIDAKGNGSKIEEIKAKQLFGVEIQAEIFTLAVSNMYIHQDGKTNIYFDSCFDIVDSIKTKRPNVGFLNPPYRADKKKDICELEFILNNLECLVDGGTCIAIVPMQCALASQGRNLEFKQRLLEKHTLEAVLSMPNELFADSNTSVVSCVMIFTAHKAHPAGKETFFGYFKDDGFVKRKNRGRIDANGTWATVKENWLKIFRNRSSVKGISVVQEVSPVMEWCAEAYMETDYSNLSDVHFDDTILNYVTYLHKNRLVGSGLNESLMVDIQTNLVEVQTLFDVEYGVSLELVNLEQCRSTDVCAIPFVSRTDKNNGVSAFVKQIPEISPNPGHTLSVAGGGSVLSTFYQPIPYYSGFHLFVLTPKQNMDEVEMLFFARCISKNSYRYNYGRQANRTLRKLLIPARLSQELRMRMELRFNQYGDLNISPLINKDFSLNH